MTYPSNKAEWFAFLDENQGLTASRLADMAGVHPRTVEKWRRRRREDGYTPHSTTPAGPPSPITQRSQPQPFVQAPSVPVVSVEPSRHSHAPSAYTPTSRAAEHRILLIPDTHVPYEDRAAWQTMLAAAQTWRPTAMVILGDFLDLYSVSGHPKDPSVRLDLQDEIDAGKSRIDELDALGIRHKYYVAGNHEARLKKHIGKHSPAFHNVLSVPELLGLERRGWQWTPYGDGLTLGELYITHDVRIAGKYAVRRSLEAAWQSIVIGHTHRCEVVYLRNAVGRLVKGASFGWLGDFRKVEYMHQRLMRQWVQGFGLCHMTDDGLADIQAIPIHGGRCRVEGNIITASDYSPSRSAA